MNNLQRSMNLMAILFAALLLVACGGGGGGGGGSDDDGGGGGDDGPTYSGSSDPATVDEENSEDVGRASAEGALASVEQEESDTGVSPFGTMTTSMSLDTRAVSEMQLDIIRQATSDEYSLTPQDTATVPGDCGGDATVTSTENASGTEMSGSVVYNDFCVPSNGSNVVFNGTVDFSATYSDTGDLQSFRFSYQNFTYTANGETQTVNATYSCDYSGTTISCATNFAGTDGRTYRTTNVTVTGDSSTGYNVTARVYDPDHGYVDIEATGVTTCSNGNIGTGSITVSDHTGDVMTITFHDCSSYTVSYNGNGTTYNW